MRKCLQKEGGSIKLERRKEGVNIRILRVYLEAVTPHNSTFEPHFEVYHYLEWIRNVKIT